MAEAHSGSHPSLTNGPEKHVSPLWASFSSLQLVVLNWRQFYPPGDIDRFYLLQLGVAVLLVSRGQSTGLLSNCPTMHRTATTTENYPAQNCNSAAVEKPALNEEDGPRNL